MKRMSVVGWALVLLSTAACGGGAKTNASATSASSSSSAGDSHLTMVNDIDKSKVEVTGPAFGVFDSVNARLHVLVVDANSDPAPSCAFLTAQNVKKGGLIDLQFQGKPKPGKADIAGSLFMFGDQAKGDMSAGTTSTQGVSADFKSIDDKTFDVTVASGPSAPGAASGTIHGTMCPDVLKVANANGGAAQGSSAMDDPTAMTTAGAPEYQVMIGGRPPADVDASKSLAKIDPKTKTLLVASFPAASTPTCEWLATPSKAGKTGTVTMLYATGPKLEPGFLDVPTGETVDLATGAKVVGAVGGEMAVSKLDDKTLVTDIHNKPGGPSPAFVVGDITATMCPPGAITIPKDTPAAASGGKKSGGKSGKKH